MENVIELSSSDSCTSLSPTNFAKALECNEEKNVSVIRDSDSDDSLFDADVPMFDLYTRVTKHTSETVIDKSSLPQKYKRFSEHFVKCNDKKKTDKRSKSEKDVEELVLKQQEYDKKRKDREILKEQQLREKLERQGLYEQHKVLKPGECIKYIKAVIDPGVLNSQYGHSILSTLGVAGIATQVADRILPCSIGWRRQLRPQLLATQGQMAMSQTAIDEPNVVLVWLSEEIIPLIKEKTLITKMNNIKNMLGDVKITLALCGIQEYFKKQTAGKDKNKNKKNPNDLPFINRRDFEWAATEMQITTGVDHRILGNGDDLALFIQQYSKSVAEIPFKNDRYERDLQTDGCIAAGPKDCVAVVKGVGLGRLFKQQLVQFNRATLETAEAITSKYPSLKKLLQAYDNCTPDEGPLLLSDIPVRRAAGPLSNIRKIGPEMSKRIYLYYSSLDAQAMIGE